MLNKCLINFKNLYMFTIYICLFQTQYNDKPKRITKCTIYKKNVFDFFLRSLYLNLILWWISCQKWYCWKTLSVKGLVLLSFKDTMWICYAMFEPTAKYDNETKSASCLSVIYRVSTKVHVRTSDQLSTTI